MGKPVYIDIERRTKDTPVDFQMAATSFFLSPEAQILRRQDGVPEQRMRLRNQQLLHEEEENESYHQETNPDVSEHPVRRVLRMAEQPAPRQTNDHGATIDTLEDMIIRQLRPRNFSLLMGNSMRTTPSLFGTANENPPLTLETAMQRLRRQIRSSHENEQNDLFHREMEPRDRLEWTRSRTARSERHQTSLLAESFQRWNINRRNNLEREDGRSTTTLAAREIYSQMASQLQRTRELLAARRQQQMRREWQENEDMQGQEGDP